MITRIALILVLLILAPLAYIRLAPMDVDIVHLRSYPKEPGNYATPEGFEAVRKITATPSEVLTAVEQRALATPRTKIFAGSAESGMITFVTRSFFMGFPDYTTVYIDDDLLVMNGRLRFGGADLGVNRARLEGWLETLVPLTEPL